MRIVEKLYDISAKTLEPLGRSAKSSRGNAQNAACQIRVMRLAVARIIAVSG